MRTQVRFVAYSLLLLFSFVLNAPLMAQTVTAQIDRAAFADALLTDLGTKRADAEQLLQEAESQFANDDLDACATTFESLAQLATGTDLQMEVYALTRAANTFRLNGNWAKASSLREKWLTLASQIEAPQNSYVQFECTMAELAICNDNREYLRSLQLCNQSIDLAESLSISDKSWWQHVHYLTMARAKIGLGKVSSGLSLCGKALESLQECETLSGVPIVADRVCIALLKFDGYHALSNRIEMQAELDAASELLFGKSNPLATSQVFKQSILDAPLAQQVWTSRFFIRTAQNDIERGNIRQALGSIAITRAIEHAQPRRQSCDTISAYFAIDDILRSSDEYERSLSLLRELERSTTLNYGADSPWRYLILCRSAGSAINAGDDDAYIAAFENAIEIHESVILKDPVGWLEGMLLLLKSCSRTEDTVAVRRILALLDDGIGKVAADDDHLIRREYQLTRESCARP